MVEVLIDPAPQILEFSKIDHEAVAVGLAAGKCQRDLPVVSVYERAMPIVVMLAVGERNVAVGLFTGEHSLGELRIEN